MSNPLSSTCSQLVDSPANSQVKGSLNDWFNVATAGGKFFEKQGGFFDFVRFAPSSAGSIDGHAGLRNEERSITSLTLLMIAIFLLPITWKVGHFYLPTL